MSSESVKPIAGGYRFSYPLDHISLTVNRIVDDHRTMATSAEITAASTNPELPGHLHQARVNLTSAVSKRDLIKSLAARNGTLPWADIIEAVCLETLRLHREGEPLLHVGQRPPRTEHQYILDPLLPLNQPTLFYGEGGTGKSYLAWLFAIMIQTQTPHAGLSPSIGNVLYLDYETSDEEANDRVQALCLGNGLPATDISYRYCYHPLADDLPTIQDLVAENNIDLIIVDSLGTACGGDPSSAEVTVRMMNAIRSLHVTSLLIDHVSKNAGSDKTTPFGSVYKFNAARSIWETKKVQHLGEHSIRIGLYHRKCNNGPLQGACGFQIDFQQDSALAVSIKRTDVRNDSDLARGLPQRERVLTALRAGTLTTEELAEATGIAKTHLGPRLTQYRQDGLITRLPNGWGLATKEPETDSYM